MERQTTPRPPSTRIIARFPVEDAAMVQARAIAQGVTVSDVVRHAVRQELARTGAN